MSGGGEDLRLRAERFLIDEARLLDAGEYADWLALFDDDAVYWVPAAPDQTDPLDHVSIIHDDRAILEMRVNRLLHPHAYALEPVPRTTRLVSNVTAERRDDGLWETDSAFVMAERRGEAGRTFAGRCRHLLRPDGGTFRIRQKRVDLMDSDAVHELFTVPF